MVNGLEQSEMYQHEEIELRRQKSPGKCLSLIQFQKYIKLGDGAQTTLNCLMVFFFFVSKSNGNYTALEWMCNGTGTN